MKKIVLLLTFVAAFILSSCDEESAGVSTVTTYPTITLEGDEAQTILVGGNYVENGYVAKEGENDITANVIVDGTVNTAKSGVYTITYTVANKDGFTTSSRRYIGVITPSAAAMDISGSYKRNAGVYGIATVTKTSYPGLYINDNPGGIAAAGIDIYMFHTDATVVSAPSQSSSVGEFACTNGVYDDVNKLFSWICINVGYGTAVRTYIKL
ncbi:MAG: DUF5011 domain-containing protein [Bacteroidales bacterium]